MSQWTERVRDHQVWNQLTALGPAIDEAIAREGNDPTVVDGLERLRSVLAFSGKRMAAIDPFLVHLTPVDGVASYLEKALIEVQAYNADGNAGHIKNANAHADLVLSNLAQLNSLITQDDLTVISEAAAAYRATLEKYLKDASTLRQLLQGEVDTLRTKLNELTTELSAERQRVSSLTSEFQSQFSTAQEARGREFTDAQTTRQDKFGALIADYNEKLTEQNADFERQKEAAIQNHAEELDNLKNQYEESAKSILNEINNHKAQVEKLVGVIGNLGVTSGYLKTANHARRTLWFWQLLTVGALGGVIVVAYKAFVPLVQGEFTWESFAARVFLSLTVGVLAAYSANQADKFLEIERRNRKLALELEALGPYLAPLPQQLQDKFRVDIGDRSFGHQDASLGHRADKSPATLVDALQKSKDLREFVVNIIKASRN
jgi:FtsZ-binding cell division protein ZapB